jgi:penicillin-binding protein 1C
VGNFDGSAMRGVSGVTGAGPLWNRIMLHLHELRDPPAFPKPRGYVRATICATTGRAPARDCLASVQEWVRARDLATIKRALPADTGGLQIIFPHDGDVFVVNHAANALEAREQRIALRAVDAGHSVQWSVAGATLAGDATGTPFWPLRVGTWTLQARAGDRSRSVTIHVVPARANLRPGFTRD